MEFYTWLLQLAYSIWWYQLTLPRNHSHPGTRQFNVACWMKQIIYILIQRRVFFVFFKQQKSVIFKVYKMLELKKKIYYIYLEQYIPILKMICMNIKYTLTVLLWCSMFTKLNRKVPLQAPAWCERLMEGV